MIKASWSKAFKLFSCVMLLTVLAGQFAYAKDKEVHVYIHGKRLPFTAQSPVIINGTTLVPFRPLFEALDYKVTWNGAENKAIGTKEGMTIELTIGSTAAKVNGKTAKLTVPAQIINGNTMIPLRFVSENSGYKVSYAQDEKAAIIRIGDGTEPTSSSSTANNDKLEPYVVKGRVVNAEGKPIKGALITVDNQLLYNSNAQAVTDADGWYRIPLGLVAATYIAYGELSMEYNGNTMVIELTPDDVAPFAGNTGAIRNFKMDSDNCDGCSGDVLFYMMDLIHPLDPIAVPPDRDYVELTMIPVGPQLNGSQGGTPITGYGYNTPDGFGLHKIPIGRYEISATYNPPGEEPQQMLVRIVSRGRDNEFTKSVTAEFTSITSKIHRLELELKLNVTKLPEEEPGEWSWD